MKNASNLFASTLGTIVGVAGLEHGIGEVLQGNVTPDGLMILSWPEADFFRIMNGEPAMTIIPNLLVSGILTILISLFFIVWAIRYVHRKHGGLVLILITIPWLLAGGGIFPPFLGLIVGAVGTRINSPLAWWRKHFPAGLRGLLGRLWRGSFIACVIAWLCLFPGINLFSYFLGVEDPNLMLVILSGALGAFLLTIFTGFAYDSRDPVI
jgi:hypothetical protein